MSIENIPGKGVPRAKIVCDECGADEVMACDYHRSGRAWRPDEGQMVLRATSLGWELVKGKHHCPKCKRARKTEMVAKSENTAKPEMTRAPEGMDKAERRKIVLAITAVWDEAAERYTGDYTDRAVADEIGVMPGFVRFVREDIFGGSGGNEQIEALREEVGKLEETLSTSIEAEKKLMEREVAQVVGRYEQAVTKRLAEVSALRARMEKVESGLDMRVGKQA